MKTIRMPATKKKFILISWNCSPFMPTAEEMQDLISLVNEYKISAEDINKMLVVKGKQFDEIFNEEEYVYLISNKSEEDFTDLEALSIIKTLEELNETADKNECPYIILNDKLDIERINKNLLCLL